MDSVDPADTRDQLMAWERWLFDPGSPEAVDAVLAADFVEVGASGRQWTRADAVDLVEARRGVGIGSYELFDIVCRALAGSAYLLTYAIRTERGLTRRASVWDVIDGRWQMIYHQGTPAASRLPPARRSTFELGHIRGTHRGGAGARGSDRPVRDDTCDLG